MLTGLVDPNMKCDITRSDPGRVLNILKISEMAEAVVRVTARDDAWSVRPGVLC